MTLTAENPAAACIIGDGGNTGEVLRGAMICLGQNEVVDGQLRLRG